MSTASDAPLAGYVSVAFSFIHLSNVIRNVLRNVCIEGHSSVTQRFFQEI